MCDTRTVSYEQRFFLTNNALDPKIYMVTKIVEMNPQGILKLSIKQDEYDADRDNADLQICNYYTDTGGSETIAPPHYQDEQMQCSIRRIVLNDDGTIDDYFDSDELTLHIAEPAYFQVDTSDNSTSAFNWRLMAVYDEDSNLESRIKVEPLGDSVVCIRPGRSNLLIGKRFQLTVDDYNGTYASSTIELEVEPCSGT